MAFDRTRRRKNPVSASTVEADARQAALGYKRFTGMEVDEVLDLRVPDLNAVYCVGEVDFIGYTTTRDGVRESYRHDFKKVNSRPLLCISPDGTIALLLSGAWRFTERGFVDR